VQQDPTSVGERALREVGLEAGVATLGCFLVEFPRTSLQPTRELGDAKFLHGSALGCVASRGGIQAAMICLTGTASAAARIPSTAMISVSE